MDLAALEGAPVIFNAFRPGWGFSEALWGSAASVDDFIARAPSGAHFVFLGYAGADMVATTAAPPQAVVRLRRLFQSRLGADGARLLRRLHFVDRPVESLAADPAVAWLPRLLRQYPTFRDGAEADVGHASFPVAMLNSMYDWLGWAFWPSSVFGNASVPLASVGDGCGGGANLTGHIALATPGGCGYYAKAKRAAARNASGLAVVAEEDWAGGSSLVSMGCAGAECEDQSFGLPAFMVAHHAGERLRLALAESGSARLRFFTEAAAGTDFGVDAAGRLRQTWGGSGLGSADDATYGNPGDRSCKLYPSLSFVAWAAQGLDFRSGLEARLAAPAHVVDVFDAEPIRPRRGNCYGARPWGCGPSSVVPVPTAAARGPLGRRFARLELDFALGCGLGPRDVDCPKWDHVVTLLACCGAAGGGGLSCDASRGFELGRWITAFGRGVGRWATDVSPLLPLLVGSDEGAAARACNLTVLSVPWAGNQGRIPWTSTLRLRFVEPPAPAELRPFDVLRPWAEVSTSAGGGVYELFRWIAFNQSYETRFPPFHFDVTDAVARADLMAVVSGHGNDNHGCGEFCATTHHFTLNGQVNVKRNDGPLNAALGCADSVDQGTTPNEYGTWLYGRDGWCNGRGVEPWVADVTAQLRRGGNVLEYHGLYNGSAPDPSSLQQGAPVMMLRVYLVLYRLEAPAPDRERPAAWV